MEKDNRTVETPKQEDLVSAMLEDLEKAFGKHDVHEQSSKPPRRQKKANKNS